MTNINVRVVGTANVTQMSGAFGKLQAQVAALNAQLAKMVALNNGVDPAGYQRMAKAAALNDRMFRAAVGSTGMFEQQQLRVNRATDDYIDALKRQKLSFREMAKQRKIAAAAYKEQLAMEQMMVRQSAQGSKNGRQMLDVTYPKQVSKDLDTAGKRLAFFNHQLKSGAHQMVNWGKNTQWAGRQLMVGFTLPIMAAGAAAGVLAYQMDKEFTRIAKVYDTTADATSSSMADMIAVEKELAMVREAGTATAIKSARQYGQSATDTLKVQAELAATGQKGVELQKGTAEVMRIARLGEVEHQTAIEATIALQSIFRMSTDELTESFNYMNSIENATSLSTADFATAIPVAASAVKAFGGDVKELGILMTAMKENGIQASEGANALKATMQRLGRPSKQIRQEWQALTGTDITKLVDESNGLVEVFTRINEATANIGEDNRRKAFAGLFGSYQVAKMMALTKGMGELQQGIGQVSAAYEISQQSASSWADTADREIKRYQESISGRWDTTFQEMKIQLSTLGEPFVQIATVIVGGISKIIAGFNKLPNLAKWAIAAGIGLAAIAGPLVMLAGLFANLAGNLLKGIAVMTGWIAKMNIGTAAQRAGALATQLQTAGFITERTAVQQLTVELGRLAAAQTAANSAMLTGAARGGLTAAAMASAAQASPYINPATTYPLVVGGGWDSSSDAENKREKERTKLAEKEAKARAASARNMKLMAASGGVAAAAMATMMLTSNETANNIAQFAMIGALVVPAVVTLVPLLKTAALATWSAASGMVATSVGAARASVTTLGFAGAARAAAVSIHAMLGPLGWITLAASAIAFSIFKWHQSAEDARKELELTNRSVRQGQADVLDLTKKWADETGRAWTNYVAYNKEGEKDYKNRFRQRYMETVDFLTKQETTVKGEDGKEKTVNTIENFKSMGESQQAATLANTLKEALLEMNMTIAESEEYLTAFLDAAGIDMSRASMMVDKLVDEIGGSVEDLDWAKLMEMNNQALLDSAGNPELSTQFAERYGQMIATGIGEAKSPEAAKKLIDQMNSQIMGEWDSKRKELADFFAGKGGVRATIMNNGFQAGEWAKGLGLEGEDATSLDAIANKIEEMLASSEAFRSQMLATSGEFRGYVSYDGLSETEQQFQALAQSVWSSSASLEDNERATISAFGGILGLDSGVDTLKDSLDETTVMLLTLDKAGRTNALFDPNGPVANAINGHLNEGAKLDLNSGFTFFDKDMQKNAEDAAALDKNLQDIKRFLESGIDMSQLDAETRQWLLTLEDTYDIDFKGIGQDIEYIEEKAKSAAGTYSMEFEITSAVVAGMRKDAMQGIQDQISEGFSDDLDSRQQAAMDSRQAYWDKQQDAQENRFQRQQDAMDAKWERRKDKATQYWDGRVEAVQNAIEAERKAEDQRQKMFDAEMSRISRLNEAMNRNIDFNVALNAGNFDEAAKIRNDSTAGATQSALERAAAAGSDGSANRIERLEERADVVEAQRDKYMKALDKREEDERRHLDKIQDMQKKAIDARTKADIAGLQRSQEAEKKSLDQRLEMFMSYLPANQKELKKHMNNVNLDYNEFGGILQEKGNTWGKFYGDGMDRGLRLAANKLKSDAMWKNLGADSADGIVKGMGFMNLAHFKYFVKTGNMKMDNGRPYPGFVGPVQGETRHEGGFVGSDGGSRKGVARNLRGLHASEKMVRAQKGEYIVNRKAASKHANVLENINNDKYGGDTVGGYGVGGLGAVGLVSGMLARGLISGMARSMGNAKTKAESKSSGSYSSGPAGKYGDRSFDATQLKNAATIASVGSGMGMTTRDIMIGIMTAITESGLRNVNYGDRDSLGLFQQRPSQGWGTPEQVTNPQYAARKFFEGLKGVSGRNKMEPWLAAQAVQRSFDPTGGNYRQYWDEANAIVKNGLTRGDNGAYTAGGFIMGAGGKHRPVKRGVASARGIHYLNAIDIGVPRGTPVFAAADGKVVSSRDIAGPLPSDNYRGDGPYGSYGRVIEINHGGFSTLYAHLSQRYAREGQQIKGGSRIGLSGNTGNSSGPHLHFGAPGTNPYAFLKKGGTVRNDNTPAILHKNERVLTAPLTSKLDSVVDAMYRSTSGYGVGGVGAKPYGEFKYTPSGTGPADSPYTNFQTGSISDKYNSPVEGANSAAGGSNSKTGLRIGTLNTYVKTSAKATISDLARLTPNADFLALTEMARKAGPIKKWLAKNNWGAVGSGAGTRSASLMAYNKGTQILRREGQRKLGDKRANVIGGRETRYANYGMFTDKKSGRNTWQVAAHTVPAGKGLNAKNAPLYHEQWGNLNRLVTELQGTGAPVFVSGDLNVHKGRSNFQTPGNLNEFASKGVDYVFGDKKLSRLQRQWLVKGMHTDHGGRALMSQFSLPQMKTGGTVKYDNTIANLHRNERVLTAANSKALDKGLENLANGGSSTYNIDVYANDGMDVEALANRVITKIERKNARKPQRRSA